MAQDKNTDTPAFERAFLWALEMSLEQALKEAYASAPTDRVIFDTLELRHPSFVDDSGMPTAIRVVIGYEDVRVRLEGDAPLNGGEYVDFVAGAFRFALPGFEENKVPELKIIVDNVTREIEGHLEAAKGTLSPIGVTYRPYLSNDLTRPQINPPIHMSLTSVVSTGTQVSGTASLSDVHNWPFPAEKYLASRFPGLIR